MRFPIRLQPADSLENLVLVEHRIGAVRHRGRFEDGLEETEGHVVLAVTVPVTPGGQIPPSRQIRERNGVLVENRAVFPCPRVREGAERPQKERGAKKHGLSVRVGATCGSSSLC